MPEVPEADNGNRSAVHWDLVCLQDAANGGGEIRFDGELVRKDGLFMPEDLQPLNPELHNNLGTVLAKMGNIQQAEQSFEKALRLQPDFDLARSNLARARSMLKSSD